MARGRGGGKIGNFTSENHGIYIKKTPLISTTCSNCRRVVLCSYFIGSHERLKRTSTEALISSFDSSINDA